MTETPGKPLIKIYKMNARTVIIILLLILSAACSTIRRYSSVRYAGTDTTLVDIGLFGYRLYPSQVSEEGKDLWELNATAQANLLEILDKRFPENDRFLAVLSNNYPTWSSIPTESANYTDRDLRLIISVSRERDYTDISGGQDLFNPVADRIEYLTVKIRLPDSVNLDFTGWNRYSTEYGEIDIADVSFTRSLEMKGGIEAEAGPALDSSPVSFSRTRSLTTKEDQNIASRYIKLNGRISEKVIELEEEGNREVDLSGNIAADVSLSFGSMEEVIFIPYVFTGNPESQSESKDVKLVMQRVNVPDIENLPEEISADMEYDYVYRHVSGGNRTYQEWDDRVEYYTGKRKRRITLLTRNDIVPPFHTIGTQATARKLLTVRTARGLSYALKFMSWQDALLFHEWLCTVSVSDEGNIFAGDYSLWYDGKPVTGKVVSDNDGFTILPYYVQQAP